MIQTEVKIQEPISRAYLGNGSIGLTFPFNPDTVQWNYQENIVSMDTLGGRVVQLLSIQLQSITVNMRAGSRESLQHIATQLKSIMGFHTNTLEPVQFKVPSRNWNFLVYLAAVPQLGWDVSATSYPFGLTLLVEDDLTGVKTKQIANSVIDKIRKDIGYNENAHGGTLEEAGQFYNIVDALSKVVPMGGTSSTGGIAPVDCNGSSCTVAAFMTSLIGALGGNPTPELLSAMVCWAKLEGGGVCNPAAFNLCNTGWTDGVQTIPSTSSFPAYASFQDGVTAHAKTLQQNAYGYPDVIAAIQEGNPEKFAVAIWASQWCEGGHRCYGSNGRDLLDDCSFYGKIVLLSGGSTNNCQY